MIKIYSTLAAVTLSLTVFGQVKSTTALKSADSRRVASPLNLAPAGNTKPTGTTTPGSVEKVSFLTEGFTSTTFPPTGWTVISGPQSTTTVATQDWHRRANGGYPENIDALNGTTPAGCAGILWINAVDQHDEYMRTPAVTLPSGGDYRLAFDFASSPYWHNVGTAGIDNADIKVTASIDGGTTWGPVLWQEDSLVLLENSFSEGWLDLAPYNWTRAFINVSQYEGESVIFSFHYKGLDGAPFFLDNVLVEDIPANDLTAMKAWSGDISAAFDYSMVPLAQVIEMEAGVAVRNSGSATQTGATVGLTITRGATTVYTGSGTVTLAPGETDTLWISTGYTPDQVGEYTLAFTLPTDDGMADNTVSVTYTVTTGVYAHDFPSDEIYRFDQDEVVAMGNVFQIEADATLYNATVDFETGTTPNLFVTVNVYEMTEGSIQTGVEWIGGYEGYNVPVSAIGTGTTVIPLDVPVDLNAGSLYILEVIKLEEGADRMFIGGSSKGDDDFSTANFGPFGTGNAINRFNGWGWSPAIRMDFTSYLGVNENDNANKLNIYPNPATSNATVSFNLNSESTVNVTVTDLTGKVVYSTTAAKGAGAQKMNINTEAFAQGVYVVNFEANNTVTTQRLVIR